MKSTKLKFSNNLPDHSVILQSVQGKFPASEAKLSYNGFIDIAIEDVAASLDLTDTEIIVNTKADNTKPKFILLFITAFVPYMYFLLEFTNLQAGTWHFGLAIAIFLAMGRGLIYWKTKPTIERMHSEIIAFLKEKYQGQEA